MKKFFAIIIIMVLGVCSFAAKEIFIATVDFTRLINEYERSQNVQDLLKMELDKRQGEIAELGNKLKEREEQIKNDKQSGKLTDAEYKKTLNDYQVDIIGFKKKANEFENELKELEQQHFESIRNEINNAIKKISAKMNIKYVLEITAVHFGGLDVTDDVLKELNSKK
ncbi:MAG: OmpH family outer membrane protein [Candidatus Muirbacterium halophilum]|nr:OmpH family outer membrane protein [Candidatus Muirbacterium halophilum]MCK9474773.1 OmpH family outer membrane protein [Candidatus Muirbacterium halophilum]